MSEKNDTGRKAPRKKDVERVFDLMEKAENGEVSMIVIKPEAGGMFIKEYLTPYLCEKLSSLKQQTK